MNPPDDTDDVAVGCLPREAVGHEPAADDDDVGVPAADSAAGGPRAQSRRRNIARSGYFGAWLVGCPESRSPCLHRFVIGVAECQWEVKFASEAAATATTNAAPWGTLEYVLVRVWRLSEHGQIDGTMGLQGPLASRRLQDMFKSYRCLGDGLLIEQVLRELFFRVDASVLMDMDRLLYLCRGEFPARAYSISLGRRLPSNLIEHPPMSLLRRLREQRRADHPAQPMIPVPSAITGFTEEGYADLVVQLPARAASTVGTKRGVVSRGAKQCDIDPIRILSGLQFKQFLRSTRDFSDALDAGHAFDHPDSLTPRSSADDPSRSTWDRAPQRLDVVGMLLQRRQFHAERKFDMIRSIHLYSDSSPVTSEELQGMIMDVVRKDGGIRRSVLPGSTLAYGQTSAIAKGIALLWALFLVCGPDYADISYAIGKVRGLCTDFGTEVHIIEIPDCLGAFLSWTAGAALTACAPLVRHGALLFHNAIRVSGWCHSWGNLMKHVAGAYSDWPLVLDQMRALVFFWRNKTWRQHLKKICMSRGVNLDLFDHFPASIAKWRCETIPVVMRELLGRRYICEHCVDLALFPDAQDRQQLQTVVAACRDKKLWQFMQCAYRYIFSHCERYRHWGMTCSCPDHVAQRQAAGHPIHIQCMWNSRKLKHAWPFLRDQKDTLLRTRRALDREDTEDSDEMFALTGAMLLKLTTGIDSRFKYLSKLPWAFARADSVEGALEVMRQFRARPPEQHDHATKAIMNRVGGDIDRRSRGEPASDNLLDEARAICDIPLDESCGEGYHRSTHHEKTRAPSSTSQHLKQATRFRQNLQRVRAFARKYGRRGEDVVRHEWRNWKRILRTSTRRRWVGVRMEGPRVLDRVCRQDERAEDDWCLVLRRSPFVNQAEPDPVPGRDALRNEYLDAVLKPGAHYSASFPSTAIGEDGAEVQRTEHKHFFLLEVAYKNRRPKEMATMDTMDEVFLKAGLALLIAHEEVWEHDGAPAGDGGLDVFHVHDSEWVRPEAMAPNRSWYSSFFTWVAGASAVPGCTRLSNKRAVENHLPLMDEACPTISICSALRGRGWKAVERRVEHGSAEVGEYDSFAAVKMKSYYQALLTLPACLPLASRIPSRQPILFYKLLLAGVRVEPGQGNESYLSRWKRVSGQPGRDLAPLPPPSHPPVCNGEDDDVFAPLMPSAGPVAKRRKTQAVPIGTGGANSGSAGAAAPPPPAVGGHDGAQPAAAGHGGVAGHAAGGDDDVMVPAAAGPHGVDALALVPVGAAAGPARARREAIRPFSVGLDGVEVRYDDYVGPDPAASWSPNWMLKCPRHPRCFKKRHVTERSTAKHGDIEPLAYLHAWISVEPEEGKTHPQKNPPAADVDNFASLRGAEIAEVVRRVV
ncbi:unnamed protein product [Prorocentrum cordatum]|uniref:RNA-directed RNA polymerase n=1 Tax=Prorocentrum cordatum TaxID=2364126 RepID=A0ABN9YJD8_9DINO|nr:unnamed protein product [Polarella glacialis]